jgi:triosephosphate isomerase
MKKLIIANWKLNPQSSAEAVDILDFLSSSIQDFAVKDNFAVIFCPPYVFIPKVASTVESSPLRSISHIGAQDLAAQDSGAFTGEVSGSMLTRFGVQYVIVGHSERRYKMGETDEAIHEKIKAALRNELVPIVCIGEADRDGNWNDFIRGQCEGAFMGLTGAELAQCIVAYEPVWAISSNPNAKPDTPDSAVEAVRIIRSVLRRISGEDNICPVLYGGSVSSSNVVDFVGHPEFDGALVGGASVKKEEFAKILRLVSEIKS